MSGESAIAGRNVVWNSVSNLIVPVGAILTAPILARTLSVDGRGEVAAVTAPIVLLSFFATFGVTDAITNALARRVVDLRQSLRLAIPVVVVAGALGSGAIAVAAPLLTRNDGRLGAIATIAGCALAPTLVVAVLRAAAAGQHRWALVNAERYSVAAVRLAAVVVLALTGILTVGSAAIVVAAAPIFGCLAYIPLLRTARSAAPSSWSRGEMLGFGSRVWVGSVAGILLSRLDQVLMTPLSSVYQLGLYAVAVNMSDLSLLINNAVRDVLFAADASDRSDERLTTFSRASFLASAVMGILIVAALPLAVPLLFGVAFAAATPVCVVLVLASVLGVPGSVAGAALAARGRPGLRSLSILAGALLNVVLLLTLVPVSGAMGAAIATLFGNLVAAGGNLVFLRRHHRVPIRTMTVVSLAEFRLLVNAVRDRILRFTARYRVTDHE